VLDQMGKQVDNVKQIVEAAREEIDSQVRTGCSASRCNACRPICSCPGLSMSPVLLRTSTGTFVLGICVLSIIHTQVHHHEDGYCHGIGVQHHISPFTQTHCLLAANPDR
jgi:hypothetical protein